MPKGSVSCDDCESLYDGSPPCEECSIPRFMTPDEEEVIRLWSICHRNGRDYVGMAGVPAGIRLETVIRLCELYGHGAEAVEKVLLLDQIAYPLIYPPKSEAEK